MPLTRIQSNSSSFIQPELGSIASVIVDPNIDWLRVGATVHIEGGGIYTIENLSGSVMQVKLVTQTATPGATVAANIIYPVDDKSAATKWGGDNGKEW